MGFDLNHTIVLIYETDTVSTVQPVVTSWPTSVEATVWMREERGGVKD